MSEESLRTYGEGLKTLSLELGTTTGAAENARAAYDVASAGFVDANDNAAVLAATLKSASAGGVEAAEAAKLLSGTLRAYGADAQDAGKVSDIFFQVVKKGITTFPELTGAMGNVTAIASSAGISIEELGAAMATMTNRGIETSTASTALRGAIVQLSAPSETAKNELERLGIVVNETTLKHDGLLKTLLKIRDANGGSSESFKKILGDVQAMQAALALTSDEGKLFAENMQAMENAAGSTDAALSEKAKSFQHSIDQFKVALEAAGVSAGTIFLPAAKSMLDSITGLTEKFATAPQAVQDLIVGVGVLGGSILATQKGMVLLTTAQTRNTIATVLNSNVSIVAAAAYVKNTIATVANTVARGASTAATVAAIVATGNLALAKAALTTAMAAANTVILGTAASLGILVAAGAGIILLAKHTADAWRESAQALDDYTNAAGRMSASIDEAFDSVGMSAEELAKAGKSAKDLEGELMALKEGAENVRQEFDKGNMTEEGKAKALKKLADAYINVREKRNTLADLEKSEAKRKASEPAPSVGNGPDPKVAEKAAKDAAKVAEDARKEALEADLSAIEVKKKRLEISATQEIAELKRVMVEHKLNAAEKRKIEEEIAGIVGSIAKESAAEKERIEKESIEKSKRAKEQEAALELEGLAAKKELAKSSAERLEIEKQIIEAEKAQALAAAESGAAKAKIVANAQSALEIAKQTAAEEATKEDETAAKAAQDQALELLKLKKEGLELDLKAAETEKEKLRIKEEIIKLEGAIDSSGATDGTARAEIEKNVQKEIGLARKEAAEEEKKRHEEAMKNLEAEEAKAKKMKAQFGGGILTLEEFAAQSSMGFGESSGKASSEGSGSGSGGSIGGAFGGAEGAKPENSGPFSSPSSSSGGSGSEPVTGQLLTELATMLGNSIDQFRADFGNAVNGGSSSGSAPKKIDAQALPDKFKTLAE